MRNNPVGAQEAFEKALPYMIDAGNFLGAVADIFYQSRLAFYMGQPERAELLCQQWKKKFAEMADSPALGNQAIPEIPATRGLDIILCMLLLERNQFEEAEHLLTKTLELLGWGSWMELHGFIELARLRFLRGNYSGAQETIQRMFRLGTQHAACAEAFEILFEVKSSLDDLQVRARAEGWVKTHAPNQDGPFALGIGPYHRDAEYFCALAWAETQINLGHPNEAASFIEPALKCAQEQMLLFRVAELSILKAMVEEYLGNTPAAMADLEKALDIAESNGYTRFFDRGAELDRLLNHAVETNIHSTYASQLLAGFKRIPDGGKLADPVERLEKGHAGLVEPLSEREIEVLQQMTTGLALAEIARRLYLSPNTLKAHTQNIYTKLDVHSRIEAINKARELDLI
jgi:LuxR family maltose regulon positive regulatory protein